MGKKTKVTRGGPKKPRPETDGGHDEGGHGTNKPTHFLCFPIASEDTVPQISSSISHWMDVTTRPVEKAPHRRPKRPNRTTGETSVIGEFDSAGQARTVGSDIAAAAVGDDEALAKDEVTPNHLRPTRETFAEGLKILPPVVTRAAGTWHLTLGVMDLAGDGKMDRALEVLRGLDLKQLLREAEGGPPVGYKKGRKWDEPRPPEDEASTEIGREVGSSREGDSNTTKAMRTGTDIDPTPLKISLTGIGGFPSLKNARVLWARPREQLNPSRSTHASSSAAPATNSDARDAAHQASARLYNFALHIIQPFRDAGLITETRTLALHATVANMRFAKSRGRAPAWKSDRVDALGIARVWNTHNGVVEGMEHVPGDDGEKEESDAREERDDEGKLDDDPSREFVWLKDVNVNRIAICKLGATKHNDPVWREWYPPVEGGERVICEDERT